MTNDSPSMPAVAGPALQLTFIIPVLNGERFIARCLDHIRSEALPGDRIVVVDNGSKDRTLELVRQDPAVIIIEAPKVTIAALRNRGAAAAPTGVLAFIDADCLLCPGWRASVARVLSDPAIGAVGSYYDIPPDATWVETAWWSFRPRHEHRTSFLISGNFVVRKAAYDAIGGFDESLITDEDTDISRRLVAAGTVLVEAPTVRVIHLGNAKTLAHFFRKEKWHATSILATMRRHAIDRPMVLTFVFQITCLLALALIPLGVPWYWALPLMPLLVFTAPAATAAYRVLKHKNYRYFFQLLPMYFVVYWVRTLVMLEGLVRPAPKR
jgi:GT2 family glycosyltransferase